MTYSFHVLADIGTEAGGATLLFSPPLLLLPSILSCLPSSPPSFSLSLPPLLNLSLTFPFISSPPFLSLLLPSPPLPLSYLPLSPAIGLGSAVSLSTPPAGSRPSTGRANAFFDHFDSWKRLVATNLGLIFFLLLLLLLLLLKIYLIKAQKEQQKQTQKWAEACNKLYT